MPLHLTKFSENSYTIFPVANNYRSFIALPRAKDEQCRWNAVAKRCFSASICNCLLILGGRQPCRGRRVKTWQLSPPALMARHLCQPLNHMTGRTLQSEKREQARLKCRYMRSASGLITYRNDHQPPLADWHTWCEDEKARVDRRLIHLVSEYCLPNI